MEFSNFFLFSTLLTSLLEFYGIESISHYLTISPLSQAAANTFVSKEINGSTWFRAITKIVLQFYSWRKKWSDDAMAGEMKYYHFNNSLYFDQSPYN